MSSSAKFLLFVFAVALGFFVVIRGHRALSASVPNDMPTNAEFIPSGYDLAHNEQLGEWVACRNNYEEANTFCRVTDHRGTVVYQGAFQFLDGNTNLPNSELRLAEHTGRMWVSGPAESSPVPVIPLRNGRILVPVQDREALIDRWHRNPGEFREITGL